MSLASIVEVVLDDRWMVEATNCLSFSAASLSLEANVPVPVLSAKTSCPAVHTASRMVVHLSSMFPAQAMSSLASTLAMKSFLRCPPFRRLARMESKFQELLSVVPVNPRTESRRMTRGRCKYPSRVKQCLRHTDEADPGGGGKLVAPVGEARIVEGVDSTHPKLLKHAAKMCSIGAL
eukprot:1790825-Heterocapsa_arctica.AAC.1